MKNKTFRKISGYLMAMVVLVAWSGYFSPQLPRAEDDYMSALGIQKFTEGKVAPDFTLKNLAGQEMSLKDYRGKLVLLNFWATWCGWCRKEMPGMQRLYEEFKDQDFLILAIDVKEDVQTVESFMRKYKLTFPALLDSDGKVSTKYMVRGFPTTYLIDRQGEIIGRAVGAREWDSDDGRNLIKQLLAHKSYSQKTKSDLDITPEEVLQKIQAGEKFLLWDLRRAEEYANGHIQEAENVPFQEIEKKAAELNPDTEIVLYCHSGRMSATATQKLTDLGFKNVKSMVGGIKAWKHKLVESKCE